MQARVINLGSGNLPNDESVIEAGKETGRIVVREEHLMADGLGSAIATDVAQTNPVPMEFVNIGDTFAECGDPSGWLREYRLSAEEIVVEVKKVRSR